VVLISNEAGVAGHCTNPSNEKPTTTGGARRNVVMGFTPERSCSSGWM
jgi:hypothetical protein